MKTNSIQDMDTELLDGITRSYLSSIEPRYQGTNPRVQYAIYEIDPSIEASIALMITPFSTFSIHPLYSEISDFMRDDETVIELASFYPYGTTSVHTAGGKGIGAAVMDTIVRRECERYDASLLYCETESGKMQRFLGRRGFREV